ncbi:MAG: hypothetical protein RL662_1796 [Bacteroidota bacterium]|jgi:hypothetical protein
MEQKIPKIIHYCWLSGDPKPEKIQKCIDSWSEHMPDYEIICWDMNRFDINSNLYVKAACAERKWAFAADYIRVYALYNYGGIYFDSDVTVYQNFDPFLKHSVFTCTELNQLAYNKSIREGGYGKGGIGIEVAVMGSVPKHPWIKELMDFFEHKEFIDRHDAMRKNIMSQVAADISYSKHGFKFDPSYQILDGDVHIYPPDVFSKQTPCSLIKYSTHWCENSWVDHSAPNYSFKDKVKIFFVHDLIGVNNWNKIKSKFM